MLSHYKTEPVGEFYKIENGSLTLVPGIPGLSIDYKKLEQELRALIFASDGPFRININDSPVVIKKLAEPVYKEPFNTLVSNSNIEFDSDLNEKVINAKTVLIVSLSRIIMN